MDATTLSMSTAKVNLFQGSLPKDSSEQLVKYFISSIFLFQERPRPTNVPSPNTTPSTIPTTTSNVTTTTTPRPPEDFDCPSDGTFAHEERCEYYWTCWAGVAELIHCQLDYLFDRVYMGCNFPELTGNQALY